MKKGYPRGNLLDLVTIDDIYLNTPEFSLAGCSYCDQIDKDIIRSPKGNCPVFRIKKYVVQQYVCYQFISKNDFSIEFKFIHSSLFFDRMIYEIRFTGALARANKVRPVITDYGLPEISRHYVPSFYNKSDENIALLLSCQILQITN